MADWAYFTIRALLGTIAGTYFALLIMGLCMISHDADPDPDYIPKTHP